MIALHLSSFACRTLSSCSCASTVHRTSVSSCSVACSFSLPRTISASATASCSRTVRNSSRIVWRSASNWYFCSSNRCSSLFR
uniref:Putative secreted protein n=1 Tax=Anopheles triannulatus TaxID=58253 RepID=A0A2M4B383_9DIPT